MCAERHDRRSAQYHRREAAPPLHLPKIDKDIIVAWCLEKDVHSPRALFVFECIVLFWPRVFSVIPPMATAAAASSLGLGSLLLLPAPRYDPASVAPPRRQRITKRRSFWARRSAITTDSRPACSRSREAISDGSFSATPSK